MPKDGQRPDKPGTGRNASCSDSEVPLPLSDAPRLKILLSAVGREDGDAPLPEPPVDGGRPAGAALWLMKLENSCVQHVITKPDLIISAEGDRTLGVLAWQQSCPAIFT